MPFDAEHHPEDPTPANEVPMPWTAVFSIASLGVQTESDQSDLIAAFLAAIHEASRRGVNPYLLAGVLVQDAANVIADRVPDSQKCHYGNAVSNLLSERLRMVGMI
jgi:hypothetical protein